MVAPGSGIAPPKMLAPGSALAPLRGADPSTPLGANFEDPKAEPIYFIKF